MANRRLTPKNLLPRGSVLLLVLALLTPAAFGQWVDFTDETSTRLDAPNSLGAGDTEEKDYAWGDVDQDGDIDLVVVRKQPFTSVGKRANVLFLNEGGVLVNRTSFVVDSDLPGDDGFQTATNDRDVELVDVNGDNWLDIVTAPTLSDGDLWHLGHPRVYINLKNNALDQWLGFRYESDRISEMLSWSGESGHNPRFCAVTAGDLTGDGANDLYFGDYDNGAGGPNMPPGADFNDRLLVNRGNGVFDDRTQEHLLGEMPMGSTSDPFEMSRFGAADVIADMNGDGALDIVKQTSLQPPIFVAIAYNDPENEGFFDNYEVIDQSSPYFVNVGELNNDGRMDIVITDDGQDRYLLNQGNDENDRADFIAFGFQLEGSISDGIGSNSLVVDLDNDGWNDVLIADVDVDIPGCAGRLHIYHNQGGSPGDNVVLLEETEGTDCQGGNPTCSVASIPADMLTGVHDVAAFDINGDGWNDLVLGRCDGTQIWMNSPPGGITINLLDPAPAFVVPGETLDLLVRIEPFGVGVLEPGTERLHVSFGGSPFLPLHLTSLGDGLYSAPLPSAACREVIDFYFSAQTASGESFTDPPGAPGETYSTVTALGVATRFEDKFEGDVSGWTIISDPFLTSGEWEQAEPNGTLSPTGQPAAPDSDAPDGPGNVMAFVTDNGLPGEDGNTSDLDGGTTQLISPPVDLAGSDALVSYHRWMFSTGFDVLEIGVSNDGNIWVPIETVNGSNNAWRENSFLVSEYVVPSATVQVRFLTTDTNPPSLVEAGIDFVTVTELMCSACSDSRECLDVLFCNGVEQCVDDQCVPGNDPCPGQQCDEVNDVCVECLDSTQCDNGDFCDGAESCVSNSCVPGSDPCPRQGCDEFANICVDCLVGAECDNGVFCDGVESCSSGQCIDGGEPCPGQTCDERGGECVGSVTLQPKPGQPLLGLTASELERFHAGQTAFDTVLTTSGGLGPVFNENSCASCHNTPTGGSGTVTVTRFGFVDEKKGNFDPLTHLGGSLLQAQSISAECAEAVPPESNVQALRLTNSTLGFGLVEAIRDTALEANEISPPPGVSGRVHDVEMLEEPGPLRAGRFGWKSQVATVLTFSGDAALNEMGLTNRLVPDENAPNGDPVLLAECDAHADPEDGPDAEGFHFIDRVTDFQRFLAPPPQTPRSGMSGETVFNTLGCNSCHMSAFTTAIDAANVPLPAGTVLEEALRNQVLKPYSDFLLHDMGTSADFIAQGEATGFELRTPPLWGLRMRDPLWHDGRVLGGTFANRVRDAIAEHDALGSEAQASAQAFLAASGLDQAVLTAFLDSLGRCEFDLDGDGDVDADDYQDFLACFTGPGSFYNPDDACSVADPDADGDVDDDDFNLFLVAVNGASGEVPDGDGVPGPPLLVNPAGAGDLALSWSPSCLSADTDYAIYEGTLGDFASHVSVTCSTGGTTSATLTPSAADTYYLVVPANGFREGSYGSDSGGTPRPQGAGACLPQAISSCQ